MVVATDAHFGNDLGDVDSELVRRGVHAGVVTGPTVMAEIRKMRDLAGGKNGPPLDCRKNSAVAFTVPAGIADSDLPIGLGNDFIHVQFVPLSSRSAGQTESIVGPKSA